MGLLHDAILFYFEDHPYDESAMNG